MSSSESSSSSGKAKRHEKSKKDKSKKDKKVKKDKKAKKEDKKAKKSKKDAASSKKDAKRVEQAKEWFCDRLDAVKYTRQLLEIDANVATELEALFEMLDEGEVVRIDGLANKQVKKKLRHLLQALKLTPDGETGFKTPDRKVSFTFLFNDCLRRANEKNAAEAAANASPEVISLDAEPPAAPQVQAAPAVVDARDAVAAECGEEDDMPSEVLPPEPKAKRPRLKGPQLPMPGIGAVEGSDEEEEVSDAADDQGPRLVGEERAGVDLNSIEFTGPKRESWMTDAGKLGGMFVDGTRVRQTDKYEVKRTKAEEEAYEKMMKARGPSLLQETKEGKFDREDAKSHVDDMRKKLTANDELWGQSEKQQDRSKLGATAPKTGPARRPFNPEEDMKVRKQMSGGDFAKFCEEAGDQMSARFSRSQISTSFL